MAIDGELLQQRFALLHMAVGSHGDGVEGEATDHHKFDIGLGEAP